MIQSCFLILILLVIIIIQAKISGLRLRYADSAPINDQHAVVRHDLLDAHVELFVADGVDADEIRLRDFREERRNFLVKKIMAVLDAARAADGMDADFFFTLRGG